MNMWKYSAFGELSRHVVPVYGDIR